MSRIKAIIISGVFVLIATIMMGSMYVFSNISYSYSYDDISVSTDVLINNIKTIKAIDTVQLDGPNIKGEQIDLEVDLQPYETYEFSFDVNNLTNIDYKLNKLQINTYDEDANDYLTFDMTYDNGKQVNVYDELLTNTKRTIIVRMTYDKNVTDTKTFDLNINMDYNPSAIR